MKFSTLKKKWKGSSQKEQMALTKCGLAVVILTTLVILSQCLGPAKAGHAYILMVWNEQKTVEMIQYFSTFESCRAARETVLHAFDKYDDRYYITCSPEADHAML